MTRFAGLGLAAEKPARMTIMHPVAQEPLRDAAGQEAWIDLLSQDSRAAQRATRAAIDRRLASRSRKPPAAEDLRREETEVLAALTAGWHLVSLSGEAIPESCTPQAAAELYDMPELSWLREQVSAFVADRGNYLRS